jgi:hypothetical protein
MTDEDPISDVPPDPFAGPDWDEPSIAMPRSDEFAPVHRGRRVKVSRRRKRLLRRRRRIGWAMLGLGGLLVLAGAWLVVTGLMARSELSQVRAEVHHLRDEISAGDLTGARHTAAELARHARRAHQLATGPAWSIAAGLPGGDPIRTIRGVTASIDSIGHDAVPELITASDQLNPATLRNADGSFDLARIGSVAPSLNRAAAVMTEATDTVSSLPDDTWLSTIDRARDDVLSQVNALDKVVRSADIAARVVPSMLGQSGPKTYFMAFQNDAESRGTGGLPGAFAIVSADHGKLRFLRFASDGTLSGTLADVDFGPRYQQLYAGAGTTTIYGNANISPHFPSAAKTWASMWKNRRGHTVDGVIAVDPSALSYLLAVTGPATLPDKTKVSAANVVALTQSSVYQKFPDLAQNAQRREYLLGVARAAATEVLDSHVNTRSLVKAAGRAAGERRLLVWSADPAIEADLEQTSVSGAIPETFAPYVGLSIVNDGGNKLDYYLDRSLTWQRTGCGTQRDVTVTIKLTNNAPAGGLSTYVTGRSDRHAYPVRPGDNRLEVAYFGTDGGQMTSVTVNGKPGTATAGQEIGHPVFTVDLELPRGTTGTIVLHLTEPKGTGSPVVLRQPLVRPLSVDIQDAKCG